MKLATLCYARQDDCTLMVHRNKRANDLYLWPGDRIFIPWLDQPGAFFGMFRYLYGDFIEHSAVFFDGASPT